MIGSYEGHRGDKDQLEPGAQAHYSQGCHGGETRNDINKKQKKQKKKKNQKKT